MAARKSKAAAPAKAEPQVLLKADSATLVIRAEKDGKLRVTASQLHDAAVILPGQHLDVRWGGGQALVTRRGGSK